MSRMNTYLGNSAGNANLTVLEEELFRRTFPGQDPFAFSAQEVRAALMSDIQQEITDMANAPSPQLMQQAQLGIQNLGPVVNGSPSIPPGSGPTACSCPDGGSQMVQGDTQLHAQTYIPPQFRARHKSLGSGRHLVVLGKRTLAEFAYKRTAAGFCRAWNATIAHLGAAQPFLPSDLVQAFADMLVGASGQTGVTNGFSPPLPGRVG